MFGLSQRGKDMREIAQAIKNNAAVNVRRSVSREVLRRAFGR
jgi:hypothetical protein